MSNDAPPPKPPKDDAARDDRKGDGDAPKEGAAKPSPSDSSSEAPSSKEKAKEEAEPKEDAKEDKEDKAAKDEKDAEGKEKDEAKGATPPEKKDGGEAAPLSDWLSQQPQADQEQTGWRMRLLLGPDVRVDEFRQGALVPRTVATGSGDALQGTVDFPTADDNASDDDRTDSVDDGADDDIGDS